ncbi:Uncharacterised protein [Vibrio cholerae]|nr:Uncharacterised protein [Vibrio cholerae]
MSRSALVTPSRLKLALTNLPPNNAASLFMFRFLAAFLPKYRLPITSKFSSK